MQLLHEWNKMYPRINKQSKKFVFIKLIQSNFYETFWINRDFFLFNLWT